MNIREVAELTPVGENDRIEGSLSFQFYQSAHSLFSCLKTLFQKKYSCDSYFSNYKVDFFMLHLEQLQFPSPQKFPEDTQSFPSNPVLPLVLMNMNFRHCPVYCGLELACAPSLPSASHVITVSEASGLLFPYAVRTLAPSMGW